MQRPPNTKLNERGFASIVIALIFIIVLALLTVGFAQLARREQQTALDKQKATQANYAAESGINNAYRDIVSNTINSSTPNTDGKHCLVMTDIPVSLTARGQNINSTNGVTYSCVLVTLNTSTIQVDGLLPNSGRHMTFGTNNPLNSLTLTWGSATGRTNFAPTLNPNNPSLPTLANWPYPPMVEFSITPVSGLSGQPNPNQYLRQNTFTFYTYPSSGGSNTISYDPTKQGQVVSGACSGSSAYPCSVTLNNLGGQQFVVHFVDFYDKSNILLCANGPCPNSSGTLFTGEPVIDVTGKARDVLKRLRVRVSINNGTNGNPDDNTILPNNAVEAQNLCKRIQAAPPTVDFPAGTSYDTSTSSSCDLSN